MHKNLYAIRLFMFAGRSNLLKRINFLNVVILELLTDEFLWHSSTARGACVFAVTHG